MEIPPTPPQKNILIRNYGINNKYLSTYIVSILKYIRDSIYETNQECKNVQLYYAAELLLNLSTKLTYKEYCEYRDKILEHLSDLFFVTKNEQIDLKNIKLLNTIKQRYCDLEQ